MNDRATDEPGEDWQFEPGGQEGQNNYQHMLERLRELVSTPIGGPGPVRETVADNHLVVVAVHLFHGPTLNLYFTARDLYFRGYTTVQPQGQGVLGIVQFADYDLRAHLTNIPQGVPLHNLAPTGSYGALHRAGAGALEQVSVAPAAVLNALIALAQNGGQNWSNRAAVADAAQTLIVVTSEAARSQDIYTRAAQAYTRPNLSPNLSPAERVEINQWDNLGEYRGLLLSSRGTRHRDQTQMARLRRQLLNAFQGIRGGAAQALRSVAVIQHRKM
ncbi:ribosome-inactivating family protein [Streptomyces noursei]|uniref:ribosome-inactivating family protein n=1 Tax=Streptomyces noursei TaxID=1971 RepID=UPI0035DD0292